MLKRLLLSAVILSAVSLSSYAVDVNIPGADPSIPKDVYVQGVYSTEKIKNAYDVETRKIIDSIISKKGVPKGFGTAVNDDEVESFKNDLYSIKRRQFDGNTIVNLHNNDGGLSVTLPFSAIQKEAITDFPNSNAHYLVESPMIAAGIIENKTPNTTEKTDVVFQYDGLSKSSLRKTTLRGAVEMEIIGLKFELSKHPNQEYNVILYPRATKLVTSNDINRIMANYVVPSIYSLQDLDGYSKVETYKTYSFRVPKTAVKAKNINETLDGVTFTIDKDINQQIRIEPNNETEKGLFSTVDEIRILNKIDNKSAELFGIPGARMITKGLHTYVWNDGIPGLLLDLELDNQQGILMFITYDENHKYVNTIQYPLDNGVYSKVQLRKLITDVKLSSTGNLYAGDVWII
ncbi:MAG: hypothetical protein E6Y16_02255 [Veillonella sp.]|uniref:hypothetical protein n=1 Tax=Veillonella sp. TaxID=1926307 RepID=UPI00290C5121|nr:hypothetical protein [Veillonella sp.]MDU4711929.1 hypothetical protein [Veillonella sp.]